MLAILANVHAMNHRWQAAIETYEAAIAAGDVVHDLRRLSILYSGLSLAYSETGQWSQSALYSQKAIVLHETLNDRLSLARSENNLGLLLLRGQHNPAEARRHLDRSARLWDELGVEAGKAAMLLSLSELALAESRGDDAARHAGEALELATRLSEIPSIGDSHVWLGLVAAARGDNATVDAEFAAAFEALERPGESPERASRNHARYAEILEARGDILGAVQHLKRALAARSDQRAIEAKFAIA